MQTLNKIHLVRYNASILKLKNKLAVKYGIAADFKNDGNEEVYCGKIISGKYYTTDPKKTTCDECLNKRFKSTENV